MQFRMAVFGTKRLFASTRKGICNVNLLVAGIASGLGFGLLTAIIGHGTAIGIGERIGNKFGSTPS